jgi:hypothetical protein
VKPDAGGSGSLSSVSLDDATIVARSIPDGRTFSIMIKKSFSITIMKEGGTGDVAGNHCPF